MSPDSGLIPGRGTVLRQLSFRTGVRLPESPCQTREGRGGRDAPQFSAPTHQAQVGAARWPKPLGASLSEAQDGAGPAAIGRPLGGSRLGRRGQLRTSGSPRLPAEHAHTSSASLGPPSPERPRGTSGELGPPRL